MFKNPFSFDGRIRRLEYALTFVVCFAYYFFEIMIIDITGGGTMIGIILIIPMLWFLWAQGTKRSHDVGKEGWSQIIPFSYLILLFQSGDHGRNEYGSNPKFPEETDVLESETLDGHLKG